MTNTKEMNTIKFIQQNLHKSLAEIALLLSKKPELDATFILNQINGLQKAKTKLPEFYNNKSIIYPLKLAMEQCSSEATAIYKSTLVKGKSMLDLTGGFGVDAYYFSKKIEQVNYVEQNKDVFEIAKNNFTFLEAKNIKTIYSPAEDCLKKTKTKFDFIYIDPSRRNEKKRVFKLDECTPNIVELAPEIFKITDKILIKTAPLLDIKLTLKDLKFVTNVWVIAVDNDCKEVLYLLENNKKVEPQIHCVNLSKTNQYFDFTFEQERTTNSEYFLPEKFLYEPNVAVLKAGAFNAVGKQFQLKKIATNSHLYTSQQLVANFPGRVFEIKSVLNYQPKDFSKLGLKKANVSCRNFKDSVEQVKKKLKLKDGGEQYVFATTDWNEKPILVNCVKKLNK